MILGKVAGSIYGTIKHPFYNGKKLLIVDKPDGYLIAVDSVGAGPGDTVLVIDEGNSARQVADDPKAPLRSIIVGIVDDPKI
ncbi:MAG: EutN/CcmL family microcompartment protein [Elusimicrobia bacterium]|nr:EutN/CcmL family microcompartment protein [Elusimicrobiota bacterium]